MQFLDEQQAELICGGGFSSIGSRRQAPVAVLLRGVLGLGSGRGAASPGTGLGGSTTIDTTVNQINVAFNIVLNGGSIVNNQLNGLDLSVSA